MIVAAFDGAEVTLSEERWGHIVFRHPELEDKAKLVLSAVSGPDEAYVDASGTVHALKRASSVSDFLVVIYSVEGGRGYIRTAYYTSSRRKARRYRLFRKLKLS
jgi:hypothetical protein